MASAAVTTNTTQEGETNEEIATIRAGYPQRCRVTCDVDSYKTVITLQPENIDATVKFQLTAAYPSVVPDIRVRSQSLASEDIQELEAHLRKRSLDMIGTKMIQPLMEEAKARIHSLGVRPGKVRNVKSETFIDEHSKSKKKKKSKSRQKPQEEEYEGKLPSMKTAEDVVNRIIWDDNLDTDQFLVGYIDRFRGLMEKYFTAFSWEDIATVDYDVLAIPKHRIQYFKYKNLKVWDKTKRMDNVFGSANGTMTIDVAMKQADEQEQRSKEANESAATTSRNTDDSDEESDDDSDDEDFITVTIDNSVNIGVSEKNLESTAACRGGDYWQDRLRPNYFLCVRITNPTVRDGVVEVQDGLLEVEPILAECCIPGASLHVTLATLGLDTADQLLHCMQVLKNMEPELSASLPTSPLKVLGVSNFYSRVVYAKVQYEKDFIDFCDMLKLNLRTAGVDIRDGYEFVPHVTIVKVTRPVSRARGSKNINPKCYEKFSAKSFGEQEVDALYLCSMGDERRYDGFYLTPLELHFNK